VRHGIQQRGVSEYQARAKIHAASQQEHDVEDPQSSATLSHIVSRGLSTLAGDAYFVLMDEAPEVATVILLDMMDEVAQEHEVSQREPGGPGAHD
jgi:predicted GTPase